MCLCFRVWIWVKAKRWVVTWLMPFSRWIRDSDVSAGMNNAHSSTTSLPLFSTSCLQSSASLFITTATSEAIFTFPLTPPPSPSLPLCKRGHHYPIAAAAALLSSGQPSSLLQQLTHSSPLEWDLSFSVNALQRCFLHIAWPGTCFSRFSFCWHLHWNWLNVLMYTAHYPIMGGGSAAIDWVWQLHPWLTGVIRRVGLTDKMADKAEDKLPNQNLGGRVATIHFEVYTYLSINGQTSEYSMHLASSTWQVFKSSYFQFLECKTSPCYIHRGLEAKLALRPCKTWNKKIFIWIALFVRWSHMNARNCIHVPVAYLFLLTFIISAGTFYHCVIHCVPKERIRLAQLRFHSPVCVTISYFLALLTAWL